MTVKQRVLSGLLVASLSAGSVLPQERRSGDREHPEVGEPQPVEEISLPGSRTPRQGETLGFRSFPKELGKNFIGLFSSDNLIPLLVGAGASGVTRIQDDPVNAWFRNVKQEVAGKETSRLGNLVEFGEILGTQLVVGAGVGGLILANQFTDSPQFHNYTSASAQGFVLNSLLTMGLKQAVRRDRPDGSNRRSFPSGHTSNMFTMATITHHYYGPKYGIPAYLLAGWVGVSRLDEGVHYLSDVVAGASLGYIVGRTVVRGADRNRKIHYLPLVSSQDKMYGVAVTALF